MRENSGNKTTFYSKTDRLVLEKQIFDSINVVEKAILADVKRFVDRVLTFRTG